MSYRVKWKNLNVSLNSVGYHRQHGRNPGGFICIFLRVFFLYLQRFINIPVSRWKCIITPDNKLRLHAEMLSFLLDPTL